MVKFSLRYTMVLIYCLMHRIRILKFCRRGCRVAGVSFSTFHQYSTVQPTNQPTKRRLCRKKSLNVTRRHSSRMCTARFSHFGGGGGLPTVPSLDRDPLVTDPLKRTKEHGTRSWEPLEGTWDQAARQGSDIMRRPPVDRMTDASENITLPQTLFAGGNNILYIRLTDSSWLRKICLLKLTYSLSLFSNSCFSA